MGQLILGRCDHGDESDDNHDNIKWQNLIAVNCFYLKIVKVWQSKGESGQNTKCWAEKALNINSEPCSVNMMLSKVTLLVLVRRAMLTRRERMFRMVKMIG